MTLRHDGHAPSDPSTPNSSSAGVLVTTRPTPSSDDDSPEVWAQRINRKLDEAVDSLPQAGRDLIEAKKALGHGKFGSMFTSGLVRRSQRSAEMLMRVARHPALSNPNNSSVLPQSIHSLSRLAALGVEVVEQAIKAREIKPTMTIADTRHLVRQKQNGAPKQASEKSPTASPRRPEPESPAANKNLATTAPALFDVHAFQSALTQLLERESAKHPRRVGEMQRAATAACSKFFLSRTTTSTADVHQTNPGLAGDRSTVDGRPADLKRALVAKQTNSAPSPLPRNSSAPVQTASRSLNLTLKQKLALPRQQQ